MMSEAECIERMPFLAMWAGDLRAGFVAALNELNGITVTSPHIEGQVGIISIGEFPTPLVGIVPRAKFLKWAREIGVPQVHIDAIETPALPGTLDVLIIAGPYELVIGVPVHVFLGVPGSSEAN